MRRGTRPIRVAGSAPNPLRDWLRLTSLPRARHVAGIAAVLVMGLTGCFGSGEQGSSASPQASAGTSPSDEGDPVLPWGPTVGELAAARAEVSGWTPQRLAGQVIIGRYHGTGPDDAADLVRDLHLAGVCLTGANIDSAGQVRATAQAVQEAVGADRPGLPAVIGVDQEGGTTAHLGELATTLPPFLAAGAAVAGAVGRGASQQGEQVVEDLARDTALELRSLGFSWVFAPVADVTIGPDDPTIGTRSAGDDPQVAARATAAAVRGFTAGGIVSTAKHYPGHGSVTADSHTALPVQDAPLTVLAQRDLVPFDAAVAAGAPAVMMSHLAVTALEPGVPISLSAMGYASLRERSRFGGVAVTDSLGMGAVRRGGDPGVRALAAGADLLLMPADTRATHAAVTRAVAEGTVPRHRAVAAAANVVALQRWQARQAASTPVPDDAADRAAAASAALSAAAVTQVTGPCTPAPLRAVRVVGGSSGQRARFAAAARRGGLDLGGGPTVALVSGRGSGVRADVVVALGWPTVLAGVDGERELALFGDGPGSFDALVAVLRGVAPAPGALPVQVRGVERAGC